MKSGKSQASNTYGNLFLPKAGSIFVMQSPVVPGKRRLLVIVRCGSKLVTERKGKALGFIVCLLCAWHCAKFTCFISFNPCDDPKDECSYPVDSRTLCKLPALLFHS